MSELNQDITKAFGVKGNPTKLDGGEGTSYRVEDIVFKPAYSIEETSWVAELLLGIDEDSFRISRPIRSKTGSWVYKGWQASKYEVGEENKKKWTEKIDISRRLHGVIKDIERQPFIGRRNNPWEAADKDVWRGKFNFNEEITSETTRLTALFSEVKLSSQLIHGDMTGNVLFHETLPPLVIDFSLYWRPSEYALAIIIVDSIVWDDAPETLLDEMENTHSNNQLLIRAALWRIKVTDLVSKSNNSLVKEVSHYRNLIDLIENRVRAESSP